MKLKRIMASILCFAMVLSTTSFTAFAEDSADLIISTADELKTFAEAVNAGDSYEDKTVILANDIDMEYEAVVIGTKANPFKGTFDGKEYTVSNISIYENGSDSDYFAGSDDYLGLFGVINTPAVIKNVTVHNPYIVGSSYIGGIVGMGYTGTIENCHVTGEIDIEGYYMVGGINGHGYAKISNCSVIGDEDWDYSYVGATYKESDLEGDNVGGIVGHNGENNDIIGCEVKNVTVSGTRKVGGIVGIANQSSDITGCTVSNVTVETTATADYATTKASTMSIGGLVGQYQNTGEGGTISGCKVSELSFANENNVTVSAGTLTGGLRGNSGIEEPAVTVSDNTVSNVEGATNEYLLPAPAENVVAKIGDVEYTSLQAAVDAAQTGDIVTVIADIADEAIAVDKKLTITGNASANNVTINAITGCEELTVTGLTFTGNSWINSGEANKLTVSDVIANVTPVNTGYTNSRSGFISLGRSEQKQLDLIVERCNIVTSGDRTDSIIGWAAVKNVTIEGNTFGSETAYYTNSDAVKFMAIADGAEFAITGNTVYSNYNGFVFGQNTTRDNAYTAVIDNNTFMGSADHIWIEVSGTTTTHAKILATSDNTVNGNTFKVGDIKTNVANWTGYAGVDVVLDENKKITGGTFTNYSTELDTYVADGYELVANEDGTYGVAEEKAKISGTIAGCAIEDYTGDSYIFSEITGLNATESVVVKLFDANETLLATTTLQKTEYFVIDNLTVKFCIVDTSSSWTTVWEEGKCHENYVPAKMTLYVDGIEMNSTKANIWTSGEQPLNWGDVNGVEKAGLSGSGTKADPYLINNLDELKWFRDDVNAGNTYDGMYIKLTADINLNNEDWTPIGTSSNYFKGMFDGDNHIISNLYINWSTEYVSGGNNQNYVGLFGRMNGAGNDSGIKNLTIENADVSGCLYVGAVLGRGYTSGIIENCHVTGNVDIEGYSYIGGIVGRYEYSTGTTTDGVSGVSIYNCSVKDTTTEKGTINGLYKGATYIGGILGFTTEPNPVMCFEKLSVENISVTGYSRVGGISGIAHQGNVYKDCSVSKASIYGTDSMVGLIVGACQGTQSSPVTFTDNTVDAETKAYSNETEVTNLYGTNISGEAPVTNYVAQVGSTMYETLADALAAAAETATAENVVTVQLVAGELELGNVLFPATVNNVTIKGAENKATILKNSSLRSADGNSVDYQNITIDGIKFDNSYILFTGWRTNGVTYKDWTITNCEFYNITEEQAAVAFNLASAFAGDADEAMENFTFTNNTINGVTGEYKSGVVINAAEGDVLIDGNVIKNVGWNAVQILNVPYYVGDNTDKSDKSTVKITNNVFENAGADEGIINVYAPTGKGQVAKVYVNENKILAKNNTQPYICYAQDYKVDAKNNFWGIGTEGTAVIDLDYANKLIDVNGDKVGGSSGFNMPYYKTEAMDELYWEAKIGDKYYATVANALSVAKEGDTVVVLENATISTSNAYRGDITLDLNGKTLTVTNDLSAYDETTLTIKNGTIDLGETGTISVGISDARFGYGVVNVSEDVVITGSGDVNVIVWNGTLNTAGVIENTGDGKALSGNGMWDTTEINITDGTVKAANNTAIYHPQAGTIRVSGGSVEGDVAIVLKGGNLEISGGTLIADGEVSEYSAVSSGYVITGDALQIEHMDDSTDSDYYGTPTVSITGGTFISEKGNAVGSYTNTDMEQIVNFVSGGTFSNDVSDYVADGYELVANEDGTYGVAEEKAEEIANPFKDAPLFLAGLPDETVDGVTYYPVYMATSIDSLNYQKVGFDYIFSILNPETNEVTFTAPYTTETNEVYSSISDANTTYTVDSIGGNGAYLFMNKLMFNAEYYNNDNTKITITPYAYDMNGNKITGWTIDMTNEYYKSLQSGNEKQDMFKEEN